MKINQKLVYLISFSLAFAFVESAVVVYLRRFVGEGFLLSKDSYQVLLNLWAIAFVLPHELILKDNLTNTIEIWREFSTMVMLLSVAFLAGKNVKQRVGAFLISFSIWDIFYYIFLYLLLGWPKGLFDMDIYFLIPVVWIGPVLTPIVISLILLIVGLKLYLQKNNS